MTLVQWLSGSKRKEGKRYRYQNPDYGSLLKDLTAYMYASASAEELEKCTCLVQETNQVDPCNSLVTCVYDHCSASSLFVGCLVV